MRPLGIVIKESNVKGLGFRVYTRGLCNSRLSAKLGLGVGVYDLYAWSLQFEAQCKTLCFSPPLAG